MHTNCNVLLFDYLSAGGQNLCRGYVLSSMVQGRLYTCNEVELKHHFWHASGLSFYIITSVRKDVPNKDDIHFPNDWILLCHFLSKRSYCAYPCRIRR